MTSDSGTWAFSGPDIDDLQTRLAGLLDLHFRKYDTDTWGWFWETSNGVKPHLKVFENFADEDGELYVLGHPEVTALIDAVYLSQEQFRAIQSLGGRPIDEF